MGRCDDSFQRTRLKEIKEIKEIKMSGNDTLKIVIPMRLTWRYSGGKFFSKFVRTLKEEGKILGIKCPSCKRTYLPPRPVCGNCYREMEEWVEVGPKGVLKAFTVGYYKLLDPSTGKPRPTPFGIGLIQLDGADTLLNHYLEETDITKLRIGLRVEPVWKEQMEGYLTDILFFRAIG